jgi:hypothetical protein
MTTSSTELWTAADIAAHCKRFGLTLPEPMMKRMHELSTNVSQTGMAIARMPVKGCEPALTFTMPTE